MGPVWVPTSSKRRAGGTAPLPIYPVDVPCVLWTCPPVACVLLPVDVPCGLCLVDVSFSGLVDVPRRGPVFCGRALYRVLGTCYNPLQRRLSDMKTYPWFSTENAEALEEMLKMLFELGYYWDDDYMQCVLGAILVDIENRDFSRDGGYTACDMYRTDRWFKQHAAEEYRLEGGAPPARGDEATIRFTPSDGKYADEVFFPKAEARPDKLDLLSLVLSDELRRRGSEHGELAVPRPQQGLPARKRGDAAALPFPFRPDQQAGTRAMRKLMMDSVSMDDGGLPYLDGRRAAPYGPMVRLAPPEMQADGAAAPDLGGLELSDIAMVLRAVQQAEEEQRQAAEGAGEAAAEAGQPDNNLRMFSAHYNTPTSFRQGLEYRDEDVVVPQVVEADGEEPLLLEDMWEEVAASPSYQLPGPRGFSKVYNTPDMFRAGLETKDVDPEGDDEDVAAEPEVWMDTDTEPRGVEYQSDRLPAPVFIRPSRRGSPDEEASSMSAGHAGQPEQEEQLSQQQQQQPQPAEPAKDGQPPPPQQLRQEQSDEADDKAVKELLLNVYRQGEEPGVFSVPDEIQAEEDEVDHATPEAAAEAAAETQRSLGKAYTEGGLVFLPDQQTDRPETLDGRSLDALLKEWRGFERRERLDVKKPGPSYNVNNYFFRDHGDEKRAGTFRAVPETNEIKGEPRYEAIHGSPPLSMMQTYKNLPLLGDADFSKDPKTVNVKLSGISTWADGEKLIVALATTLNQMPAAFRMRRIFTNAVSFKVDPATSTLKPTEVAEQIMEKRDEIKKRVNVDIHSATAGNVKAIQKEEPSWQSDTFLLGCVVFGVAMSAIVVAGVTFCTVRRVRLRKELRGMAAPDTEASKDYQDLCRARMAKKNEAERVEARPHPDPSHVDQRLASLSRESEGSNNSPSSRSSTSSWTEEPALTNMDISTGHMVLAYMEDHLKNKDRLEQEWQGLCAYEAEPCEATVAQKPENVKKNRYFPHVLPYDHSRVVLNELANATGSDYINASTITDHDPRNPAYLATQGPLPHTAADLWQLVWEQGSVVMVMLSRLTENGTAMCHRYWPEEGSELYHIYEVHLVSEHIWCDDYLVRSFYLKNLKTGETRTVTQFHFLSWPDHGVPPNTKPLLDFRRKVNKSYRGRSCPIVVHCSDGAGRTGTYCLIDMVLNRMAKGAKEIDIAATLEHIRDQRANMVESKEQFEFCLQAVADEVHAILKALPAQPTPPATAVVPPPPTSPGPEKEKDSKKEESQPQQPAKEKQEPKKKT
ncbi:hypothetical protein ONE63_007946 [Megalurothrips usitatus]|uniref:Receptor-type tyrosine-protein phosphatase N2 n=1 Tax=Megalurothrips usitatus TaxID=439358 RepID=A0AAV7XVR3_9NEOP|nr:hypothetical protein ONE63_007946 [Megalurothrips usitatus]